MAAAAVEFVEFVALVAVTSVVAVPSPYQEEVDPRLEEQEAVVAAVAAAAITIVVVVVEVCKTVVDTAAVGTIVVAVVLVASPLDLFYHVVHSRCSAPQLPVEQLALPVATARCHRIGQTKEVTTYRLVTRNTYEGEMFARASRKLGLERAVMSGSAEGQTSLFR